PNYTNCFHDITTGNNTSRSSRNAFYAVTGFDLCTGWGTPNGINLINALVPIVVSLPTITSQPQNLALLAGANATFSVQATNANPLTYQWSFNTTILLGATNSSYTRMNIQPSDAGLYSVVVANNLNSVTSSNAQLTVLSRPMLSAPSISNG